MQIEKILKRIEIFDEKNSIEPNLENLTKLQESYILHVPYENLDFALKKDFSVNILKIYEKIVEKSRGGICYESNTLFIYLLQTLGYKAKMIFCEVIDTSYIGADYPHLALLVEIGKEHYLVDVANGQNVRVPMPLDSKNNIAVSENIEYKIESLDDCYALKFNHKYKGWQTRYTFTKDEKFVSDFESIFANKENYDQFSNYAPLLVTKALENGRVTLTDNIMSLKVDGDRRVWNISLENRSEVLRDYFNIDI